MRRKRLLLGLMLAIFICGVLALASATCKAKTIIVDKGGNGDFTSISAAVSDASDGDLILIKPGVYQENVVIENKSVSLVGEDRQNTVIEGKEDRHILKLYMVENAIISNLTVSNAKGKESCCIFLEDCKNMTLSNNHIANNLVGDGIMIKRSFFISVKNCIIENAGMVGLHLMISSNNSIEGNVISSNVIGIELETLSRYNVIRENTIEDNTLYGIRIIRSSSNNVISQNVFRNNNPNAEDECQNFWYDPDEKKGNYWDDYQGKDADHDGIGDTPYQIPGGGNKDEYVLGFFAGDEDSHQPTNQKPVADAGGDYYGTVNESIRFDASQSRDPDGEIVEYIWDFGDGSTGKGKVVTHSYSTPGNYTVTLTVVDDDGAEDSDTTLAHISEYTQNKKPVPVIESKDIAVVGEIIEFNASKSYDPDGEIVTYIWKFGDGKVDYGKVVEHSYSEPGTYEVTLEVVDNLGYKNSTKKSIVILAEGEKVNADFHVETDLLFVGAEIVFNASESSGGIVSYIWEFGDGENITTSSPVCNHTYTKPGIYVVNLTVVGINGEKDTKSLTIVIEGAWKKETPGFGLTALVVSILLIYVVRRRWISME